MDTYQNEAKFDLREVDGRLFNTTSDRYLLPADKPEHQRLDLQHQAITTMLRGLFPRDSGAEEALSSKRNGANPRVLDIGTGSGTWAIDVATRYPHAEVVGLDLAPVKLDSPPPSNCSFQIGDASTGLRAYGLFDVIHSRAILQGVKDYPALFTDISKALNPGGVFLSLEAEIGMYNGDKVPIGVQQEGDPDFCWAQKMTLLYRGATIKRNPSFALLPAVPQILKDLTGEPWKTVEESSFFIPCGSVENVTSEERIAGDFMYNSIRDGPRGIRVLLLASGYDPVNINRWAENAVDEITNRRMDFWIKWNAVWAVRKQAVVDTT